MASMYLGTPCPSHTPLQPLPPNTCDSPQQLTWATLHSETIYCDLPSFKRASFILVFTFFYPAITLSVSIHAQNGDDITMVRYVPPKTQRAILTWVTPTGSISTGSGRPPGPLPWTRLMGQP